MINHASIKIMKVPKKLSFKNRCVLYLNIVLYLSIYSYIWNIRLNPILEFCMLVIAIYLKNKRLFFKDTYTRVSRLFSLFEMI